MSTEVTGTISTADLYDEYGERLQSCDLQFRQFGGRREFRGEIVTLKCREDNALLKEIVSGPGEGKVLVVDGQGSLHTALVGDMIAAIAEQSGWAGLILNGCVRDVQALGSLQIGIKAIGSNPRKSGKTGAGVQGSPVSFGGVIFTPGAQVVSDEDGIVVIS